MEGGARAASIEVLIQNIINIFKKENSLFRDLNEDGQQLQRTLDAIQISSMDQDAVESLLRELEDADVLDEVMSTSNTYEVLVQNLMNVVKEDYFLKGDLHEEAKQLQITLCMIHAYLNDAEKKSISEETVRIWLRELEALAFDADKVLDELSYHLLGNRVKKMNNEVPSPFSSVFHIKHRRTIRRITATFESFNKRAADLGLENTVVRAPAAASFDTGSFTLDPIVIGRDDVIPEIVEMLSPEILKEQTLSILAIVGIDGIGKTTLTRQVFNHPKVKTRFGSFIWVNVSQSFDPIILFKKILCELIPAYADRYWRADDRKDILKRLQQDLKGITYLLVLDDVQNQDLSKWEDFINSIREVTSTKGNGIIMTTWNDKVASLVRPFYIHPLNGLLDEDCWSIIKAKAFENGQVPSPKYLMIGREVAMRCQGLPLAAAVVGAVLHRCNTEEEWSSINKNWLSDDGGGANILKILKLSYDHLASPSLMKCFMYCSLFPKGEVLKKQELIEMWIAEGFLQDDKRNDMEAVGDKFINVLLNYSLLQVYERDNEGNVRSFVMHNLVHDLASSVSSSYVTDANGMPPVRYLIQGKESRPIPKEVAKHLRTLFWESADKIYGTKYSKFESLHVLTLKTHIIDELPNSIRKSIHLRLLDFSSTRIGYLPEWIGELHHLQTLRAEVAYLKKLPSTFKYLINLRHLHIRHEVELPAEIGRLTCLQTLQHFKVGDGKGYRIEELGSLNNLKGKLSIRNLEKVDDKEEAEKANMFQKPKLFDLRLGWDGGREGETSDESVLEGLQPHPNLEKLQIHGFKGEKFPLWSEKMAVQNGSQQGSWIPLNKLIKITLTGCSKCEEIPRLDHLPNLKSLIFVGLKKVRFINSSFTTLTSLRITDLEALECLPDWLFFSNPNLSKLEINECPKLRELPDGLHTLHSLERLNIWNCPNLKSIGDNKYPWKSHGILRHLSIGMCGGLMELPRLLVEYSLTSLETLILRDLSSLENLPMVIGCIRKSACLTNLTIMGVPEFMAAPSVENPWAFGKLRKLAIETSVGWSTENSGSIKETVEGILQGCSNNSLTSLTLIGTQDWETIPEPIQHLSALSRLILENFGVEELPEWFGNLSSLTRLTLKSCYKLRQLPSGDKGLIKLRHLYILLCPELLNNIDSKWRNKHNLYITVDGRSTEPWSDYGALVNDPPPASSSPVVWLDNEKFAATIKKSDTDILIQESPSMLDAVISKISTADSSSSPISEYKIEQQFADEVLEEGVLGSNMFVNGLDSHQNVGSESRGEAQAADEITIVKDVEKHSAEIQENVVSSTNVAVRSNTETVHFEEEQLYSIVEKNNLQLKIEQQFADEVVEEGILLSNMSGSGLDSHQNVESESCEETRAADEIMIVKDIEKPSAEVQETVVSSTNVAVGRCDAETVLFEEDQLYSIVEKDNHLQQKFDDQVILIGDHPSPSTIPPMKAMINMVECDLDELSETSNYSNALIFLLQRNKRLSDISHSFFDAMPELRSLDISDTRIRILPSSLFKLSKLKVLLLRNCLCLDMLPPEIGRLVQLEALDLSGTELYDLPDEIGQLEHLRSMQLSFYGPDDESEYEHLPPGLVSPTFLSKLEDMEALSIMVHPEDQRWTEIAACVIHDMSKLKKLSSLQFYFPEVETFEKFIEMNSSWKENVLIKFDFTLGQNVKRIGSRVSNEVESLFSQHERCLRYVDGDEAFPLLNTALTRVASFYLDHHTKVESLSEFDISNFSELKFCVIRECPKLQTILDGKTITVAFPCLEYLGIFFLWELKHIWMPTPQAGRLKRIFGTPSTPLKNKNFEALRHLIIKTCPKLQFILRESMLQCLAKLEELVVEDCERVEKIIKEENKKVKKEYNFLSGLKKLVLRYLPELVALGNGVCLSKEEISFHGCPKLIFMIQEMQAGKESKDDPS